ncbi:MAG: GNAT family N-acetyltransferase, partial [Actinomycetota bacterium]|nr:GNAT family N-acetyltransferase [Actinomycetota bacterium]
MISVEDLRSGDEEDAYKLAQQAFGGTDPYDPDRPSVGPGRHVAAYLDGTPVALVRRHAFGQYFGGRRLACAGISGVTVAPQARNRGLARRLLLESIDRAAADGEAIAALYPTTAALYRSVGFEVSGWWVQRGLGMAELPRGDGSVTWERAAFDDARVVAVYDRMAPDHDGWLDPGPDFWSWRAIQARKDTKTNRYLYIGFRDREPVAAMQYSYGPSERAMYRIDAEAILGVDGAALRAALGFAALNGTTADELRTVLPIDELGLHLDHVQRTTVHQTWPWMLALVDLRRAIGARGYPQSVSGSVALGVDDPHRTANRGKWVLTVADGEASIERGGDGHIEIAITDLAAVFTGHLDPL